MPYLLCKCSHYLLCKCSQTCSDDALGTGMSEAELERNPVLTDFSVRDLNKEPKLPYEDNSFDVITNVVSVDYLNRSLVGPIDLLTLICSFSCKCKRVFYSVLLSMSATLV